jgi:two-component system response regulator DctR
MINVLVADDSDLFRQRLINLIADMKQAQVVGEARDGFETLDTVRAKHPDIVILDFYMPGSNGTALLETLLLEESPPDIIVCTTFPHPLVRQACLDLGVACFLDKALGVQHVIEALAACIEQRDQTSRRHETG